MRTLGVDYGTKRIGVAWTDPSGKIPLPLETHENKGVEEFASFITSFTGDDIIAAIVVGRPVNMQNKPTPFTEEVDAFIEDIKKLVGVPVDTVDERLTSKSALGVHDKNAEEKRDVRAAQLILETYLAARN